MVKARRPAANRHSYCNRSRVRPAVFPILSAPEPTHRLRIIGDGLVRLIVAALLV